MKTTTGNSPTYFPIKRFNWGSSYIVLTIWLSKDLFQTDVFKENDVGSLYCERYQTEDNAIKGHSRVIKDFKNIINK